MLAYLDLVIVICTAAEKAFSLFLYPPTWVIQHFSLHPHILNFPHYSTWYTLMSLCLCVYLLHCCVSSAESSAELMVGAQKMFVGWMI